MIIHHYDPITGEYQGTSEARLDPMATKRAKENIYLIPANTTDVAPPELVERQAALWVNGVWEVHIDWRGYTYYLPDGTQGTIADMDIEPLEGSMDAAPEPTLDDLKAQARAEVTSYATDARAKVSAYADQYKLAGWVDKAQRSVRIVAGTATANDLEILQIECDKRELGETPEELATLQQEKAKRLAEAVAIIDGMEDAAITAIGKKLKPNTLADLMTSLRSAADDQLNTLIGGP